MSDDQSSGSSDDGRDWLEYHDTSDEKEEELDVLGAGPAVSIRKETGQLYTSNVTGLVQKMFETCDQSDTQLVPTFGSQQAEETLAVGSETLIQLNVTQQQFGDVTVEKATHINQMFGGCQNISKTATIHEGQKGRELSRADLIMKRTISHFKAWNRGMVRTAALDQAMDKLKSGTTWLTIKGNPGEGKTTVAYMALEELHKSGRQVFEVRSPDDFTEIIETCSRPVIMLDDVFGNLEFDQAKWSNWEPVISPLLKEREHKFHEKEDKTSMKDVTVILIGRDYVLNSASVDLGRLSHFLTLDKHVVYMDNSVERSMKEKRAIWETISESSGVKVDKMTVDSILRMSVPHGFPHVCRLFTTANNENKSINAVEFFNKPLKFLQESVKNLFKDTNKVLLFKEMIKGEGKISMRELGRLDPTYKMTQTANSLIGTYIKREEDYFIFELPSIYDSVSFYMCSVDSEFVIQQCHLSFIHERVRIMFSNHLKSSDCSESNLVVFVDRTYSDDLVERFATEIMAHNFHYVLSHQAFTDQTFVFKVMSKIKPHLKSLLHQSETRGIAKLLLSLLHRPYNRNSFLSLVPSSKSQELLKYIDSCPDITLTETDERILLYGTCIYSASDVLAYLINTRKSFDINVRFRSRKTPLMIAAETRNDIFVGQILSLRPDLNARDDMKRTILHYLCKMGLVTSMTRAIESGAEVDVQYLTGTSPLSDACEYNQPEIVELLIEKGARVDEISLHAACEVGNLYIVKLLLEVETNLSTKDVLTRCLSAACQVGNLELIHYLVHKGASVNGYFSYWPPLHTACSFNQLQAFNWLLQHGAHVNCLDITGGTALHKKAHSGSKEYVDLLLKAGSTVNIQDKEGYTPLHGVAGSGSKDCVDLLLKAGAAVNIQDKKGNTALSRAAGSGSKDCVELLLKAGAAVNTQNKEGDTALHIAAERELKECVDLLLKAGAAVDKQNEKGYTGLHAAAGGYRIECVDLLLKGGATVDKQNKEGDTALHIAAGRDRIEFVDLLLKGDATVDIQNEEGDTALHRSVGRGFTGCLDLLLKAGATMNISNNEGDTALHITARRGFVHALDALLKSGAAVNMQNNDGNTALHLTEIIRCGNCLDLLLKAGAEWDISNKQGRTIQILKMFYRRRTSSQ